ncbi:MAG: hypothetical protein RIQ88_759 [Actinomycetota bacterium]
MFSKFADGLSGAAIPLLAAKLTRDPVLISIQSNMMLLPWLFFAIPLGALVDRINRRTAMLLVQLTRVLIGMTIASLVISHEMSLWVLMLLTFVFGISEVVYDTATQSSIPSLLKGHQLERGNSRLQLADTVMQQFVGVPLGAMLYASMVYSPFLGISICYLVTMFLVFGIGKQDLQANITRIEKRKLSTEIREGLVYLFRQKVLFRLVMTTGIIGFFYAMGQATLVLFLLDRLKVPEVVYGWVMIPLAIGALFGAFASPKISARYGRSKVLAVALCVSSGSLLLAGFSPNIYWYMFASLLHGFFIAQWNILLMSTYHVMIPNEIFGRIHGTRRTIVWGLMPIGGYIGGLLAKIDLSVPMIAGGALAAVVAISQFKFIKSIQA